MQIGNKEHKQIEYLVDMAVDALVSSTLPTVEDKELFEKATERLKKDPMFDVYCYGIKTGLEMVGSYIRAMESKVDISEEDIYRVALSIMLRFGIDSQMTFNKHKDELDGMKQEVMNKLSEEMASRSE